MILSKLFTVLARPRWVVGSVIGAVILAGIVLANALADVLSSFFFRSFFHNLVFLTGIMGAALVMASVYVYLCVIAKSDRQRNTAWNVMPTLMAMVFIVGTTASTVVYVPNKIGVVMVPHGDSTQAYAVGPWQVDVALPWEVNTYTELDGGRVTGVSYYFENYHHAYVSIQYDGELVDLYREWGSPQAFAAYWEARCHERIDPLMAAIDGETAFATLENKCAAFIPIDRTLGDLAAGQRAILWLRV